MIREFKKEDAIEVSKLIKRSLWEVNIKDYPKEYMEEFEKIMTPEEILKRADETHYYVYEEDNKIVGIGGIGPSKRDEKYMEIMTVFIIPEYMNKGIGRKIINKLEEDEFFLNSEKVIVSSSLTAVGFYKKMGYVFINNKEEPTEDGYMMEKKVNH